MVLDAQQVEIVKQILIVSDGRKGHLNQSIALAKYLGFEYDVIKVHFTHKIYKMLSYLFDSVGFYTISFFDLEERFKNLFGMTNSSTSELVSKSIDKYYLVASMGSST